MSSQTTALHPDDKRWYLDFIRGAIDLGRPNIDTGAANRTVLALLHDYESSTQDQQEQLRARRILDACAEDGSRRLVYGVVREARTAFHVPNRAVIRIPSRVGRRKRGTNAWQQTLWYELTWDEFDALLSRYTDRHSADATKLFAMRGIRTLRDRFPETQIVGEAVRAAGLDPQDIELRELDLAS